MALNTITIILTIFSAQSPNNEILVLVVIVPGVLIGLQSEVEGFQTLNHPEAGSIVIEH